ncbi:MAG: LacI family DNA-binding transcriptional regulator [Amaricoccus sp.]
MGIRLLARELNLSIGTVSRALNDRPDVNEETRARVKEAALRAGYVPDQSGRSLRKGRTGIVAAIIPTAGLQSDGGLLRLLEGCRRGLRRQELDLIVLFRGPDEDPLDHLHRMVSRRIADAILLNQTRAHDPRIAYLRAARIEHVALGRSAGSGSTDWVDFDFESVAVAAARLFALDGHRRLALAVSEFGMNFETILAEAFAAEAARAGLGRDAVQVLPTSGGRLDAASRAIFASGRTRPTAVLAAHEGIAAALYGDLSELDLRIGRDVALISTSPIIDNRALSPTLTHFSADLDAAGMALAERLLALLPERGIERRPVPPALVPMQLATHSSHHWQGATLAQV